MAIADRRTVGKSIIAFRWLPSDSRVIATFDLCIGEPTLRSEGFWPDSGINKSKAPGRIRTTTNSRPHGPAIPFARSVESPPMREVRTLSPGQWDILVRQREEIGGWLCRLRVDLDTSEARSPFQKRFDDLAREYHEIELLMAN
jgi:hypothetical protein